MRDDLDCDQQVSVRASVGTAVALPTDGNCLTIVDTGRNVHIDCAISSDTAFSFAGITRVMDYLSRSSAFRTRSRRGHNAERRSLLRADGSGTAAVLADFRRCAMLTAVASAIGAGFNSAERNILINAESGLLECNVEKR